MYHDWSEIEFFITHLAEKYQDKDIEYITGPPRGGLVPAVLLSHKLQIPYKHDIELDKMNSKVLWVDDIVDTGHTLLTLQRESRWQTASLYVRTTAVQYPDFAVVELEGEAWIVYPWEEREADPIQDYLKDNNYSIPFPEKVEE